MTITQQRTRQLSDATVAEFAAGFRGSVVRPGDPAYDTSRAIWNGAHDHRPALIAQCAGVADVMRTVELARSEDLPLAIRGGAHSIPGFSTNNDGIVLDLSPMKGIRVNPTRREATAQAGSLWRDLDAETQQFGLAVTGGLVSSTGIAGFTLGGGIGWLVRLCGLTADNLIGADVVTAEGQLVRASADENPELFWGLRGGGGNFGVVTSFDYKLHDIGTTVFSGIAFYPGDEAEQVLRGYREACDNAPTSLSTVVNMTTAPPLPFLPESVHGKPVIAVLGCFVGDLATGDLATQPFRSLGTVIADVFSPHPYVAWQQALDPLYPPGLHNYFRSAFVPSLDDDVMTALLDSYASLPNGLTEIHMHHLGGATAAVAPDATAFGVRDQEYVVNVVARTPDSDGFDSVIEWARGVTAALGPEASAYVNFTGEGSAERMRASYPEQTYRRLIAVKDQYDPTNLFRLNQNIEPSR